MITLENVTKKFNNGNGEIHAVKDVSLHIREGEIFGIIGFSGAGKSTLVRCINLLERPTEGRVLVDGQDLMALSQSQLRVARRKIGMIFQHFNLMKSRTVYDNIAFPLKKSKLTKQEKDTKIRYLLELVGLSDRSNAYPSQLSGGQKQRVAIARALANDPKVLLCDEATSALDPQTTKSILALLQKLNAELGITIVLITHEMAVVKEICDRVAIMEQGCVVEQGTAEDIFVHPVEDVTRSFISTADNLDKIFALMHEGNEMMRIQPGEKLVLLTYSSNNATEALISHITVQFGITASIVFANVDILKGKTIGRLMVVLHGEEENVQQAIAYIETRDVKLEVIKE